MFDIRHDRRTGIIETRLSGFLDADEVDRYVRDVQAIVIRHGAFRDYRLIVDVSGCAIQSQATLAAFARHMAAMPKARRIAVIVGTLGLSQVRRLFTQPYTRLVDSHAAAMAWLRADGGDREV